MTTAIRILITTAVCFLLGSCSYNNNHVVNNFTYTTITDNIKEDKKDEVVASERKPYPLTHIPTDKPKIIYKTSLPEDCRPVDKVDFQRDQGIGQKELESLRQLPQDRIIFTLVKQLKIANDINNNNIKLFEKTIKEQNQKCFGK